VPVIVCPHCNARTDLPNRLSGKRVRCGRCGQVYAC
jgi:predicted Zn finger-like uncharacterized protein